MTPALRGSRQCVSGGLAGEKKRRNELKDAQASLCVTGRQKRRNKLNKLKHRSIMIPRDLLGEERAGN